MRIVLRHRRTGLERVIIALNLRAGEPERKSPETSRHMPLQKSVKEATDMQRGYGYDPSHIPLLEYDIEMRDAKPMKCMNRALPVVPETDSASDLPDASYSKRLASAAIVLIWLVVSYRLTM